jgi:hypothetical protein
LLWFVLLMIAILTGVRWSLNAILICISFMARDVEHFFRFLGHLDFFSELSVQLICPCIQWAVDSLRG